MYFFSALVLVLIPGISVTLYKAVCDAISRSLLFPLITFFYVKLHKSKRYFGEWKAFISQNSFRYTATTQWQAFTYPNTTFHTHLNRWMRRILITSILLGFPWHDDGPMVEPFKILHYAIVWCMIYKYLTGRMRVSSEWCLVVVVSFVIVTCIHGVEIFTVQHLLYLVRWK